MLLDDRKVEVKLEPELDEVGLLLTLAAEHIEVNGWVQGRLYKGDRTCAMGALWSMANGHDEEVARARTRLSRYLISLGYSGDIEYWNDMLRQRAERVVRTLREAAYAT